MWWIPIILMIIAGILNACMDVLKIKYNISIFSDMKFQNWIDPKISWHTKWKIDQKLFGKQIWLIDKIMSTILVWITDLWHFVKMLMLICVSMSIVFYIPITSYTILDIIILYSSFTIPFELFYSKVFIKK